MSVLLVNPPQRGVYGTLIPPLYPPLGLLYVAAALESEGCAVRLLDMDAEAVGWEGYARSVKELEPTIVGLTAVTPTYPAARELGRLARAAGTCTVVMGGPHATALPGEVLREKAADVVVIGEGERTMVELSRALGERADPAHIPGIAWLEGDEVRFSAPRAVVDDLDDLPLPARYLLRQPHGYRPADARSHPVATLLASRGCPGRCTFCASHLTAGRRVRRRSKEAIAEELRYLRRRLGIREVHIVDDCFTAGREAVLDTAEEVAAAGLGLSFLFCNGLRADMTDRDVLSSLKRMGTWSVGYGVEDADSGILRRVGKPTDFDRVRDAVSGARAMGMTTWLFFMIGLPGQSHTSLQRSVRFALELDPDYAKFEIFKPYPGTTAWTELDGLGLILERDWSRYGIHTPPVHHLPGLGREEMLAWRRRAHRAFYLRPGKALRHMRRAFTGARPNPAAGAFLLRTML
jgi:anaerobic magnesium-protoporphyrin IX monomethyl ester cyclase